MSHTVTYKRLKREIEEKKKYGFSALIVDDLMKALDCLSKRQTEGGIEI